MGFIGLSQIGRSFKSTAQMLSHCYFLHGVREFASDGTIKAHRGYLGYTSVYLQVSCTFAFK